MKVKVGDTVKILAGKDKGKDGKVIETLKKENKVVVEGINMVKKHAKPRTANENGSIFDIEAPIHVSNVKVITKAEAKKAKKELKEKETKKEAPKEVKTEAKNTTKKTPKKEASKKASK